MEYADYVFCNDDEAKVFGEVLKIEQKDGLKDVAAAIAKWPKQNQARQRIAIVTCGKEPTLVAIAKEDGSVE